MSTHPHEDVVTIFARALYAGAAKSWIPARIRLWMWDHGLVSETTKAKYENVAYDVITAMTMDYRNDEETNA